MLPRLCALTLCCRKTELSARCWGSNFYGLEHLLLQTTVKHRVPAVMQSLSQKLTNARKKPMKRCFGLNYSLMIARLN